jgi:hypothetical protein
LVVFTEGKTVTHLLGCHIEQTRQPYLDYPIGSIYQPDEHSLAMGRAELLELNEALTKLGSNPTRMAFSDYTIWPMNAEARQELNRMRRETTSKQNQAPKQ